MQSQRQKYVTYQLLICVLESYHESCILGYQKVKIKANWVIVCFFSVGWGVRTFVTLPLDRQLLKEFQAYIPQY